MPTPRLTQHFQLANCLPNLRNLQTQQPEEEKKIESFWEVVLWTWLSGTLQRECNQAVPQDTNHFSFSIQNIFPKRRCCVFRKLDGCVSKSRRELEELNQENGGALSFLFFMQRPLAIVSSDVYFEGKIGYFTNHHALRFFLKPTLTRKRERRKKNPKAEKQ